MSVRYFNASEKKDTSSGHEYDRRPKFKHGKKPKDVVKSPGVNNSDEDDAEDKLFPGPAPVPRKRVKKYERGDKLYEEDIKTRDRRNEMARVDKKYKQSVEQAARTELLLPEESGFLEADEYEDTYNISQKDIVAEVDITSATKSFSLSLKDFGPYRMNYSRDGRHLLLGGYRGHIAAMDWVTKRLLCETNVMESVHDVCWLHVPTMYAVAQKDWVYVYDTEGIELHCVKKLFKVLNMEFLPYHFLLACSSEKGFLSWLDISVGKMVAQTYTGSGRLNVLCQNPYNAILLAGHPNGSVSMWSPNVKEPLVRMLCHPHPIRSVAVDHRGLYMATSSVDGKLKIWDVRTYKSLQSYHLKGSIGFLNFSQSGLLAIGKNNVVEVYKDCCTKTVGAPYMRHKVPSTIGDLQFCNYEDVLGVGHYTGFSSALIPGSGEANFDAYESNPYMTKSQRREMEVKALLDKIQPELITLDPTHLGQVNVPSLKEKIEKKKAILYVKPPEIDLEPKKKAKGRSKTAKVFKRKQAVKETKKREFVKEKKLQQRKKMEEVDSAGPSSAPKDVLSRFKPRTPK